MNTNSVNIKDREEEMKSSSPASCNKNGNPSDRQIDVDVLRKELLLCPGLDPESDAIHVALASEILEDTRSITIAIQGYQHQQQHH